ncbi:unnamed protein product [Discula destructiva]
MAKSSRASTKKANNQRLVAKVFGPVEDARQQRLAAKLLEIATQPKPVPEKEMKDVAEEEEEAEQKKAGKPKADDIMELDETAQPAKSKKGKKAIIKRRGKKSNIVFPKFGDRKIIRKKK